MCQQVSQLPAVPLSLTSPSHLASHSHPSKRLFPFFLALAMTSFSGLLHKVKLFVPDARTFASHAILTLGHAKRTTGHWIHGFQVRCWFFISIIYSSLKLHTVINCLIRLVHIVCFFSWMDVASFGILVSEVAALWCWCFKKKAITNQSQVRSS